MTERKSRLEQQYPTLLVTLHQRQGGRNDQEASDDVNVVSYTGAFS